MRVASIPAAAVCLILSGRSDGKIVEIWNHRHDVSLPQPSEDTRPGRLELHANFNP